MRTEERKRYEGLNLEKKIMWKKNIKIVEKEREKVDVNIFKKNPTEKDMRD